LGQALIRTGEGHGRQGVVGATLLWFGAALSCVLRDAGKGGWAAAATASSAALAVVYVVHSILSAALAYSIAGSGNTQLTYGLNDLSWVLLVVGSFLAAMFVMSGAFGLWRAGTSPRRSSRRGDRRGARPGRRNDLGR
jgi:hypothetical protein